MQSHCRGLFEMPYFKVVWPFMSIVMHINKI